MSFTFIFYFLFMTTIYAKPLNENVEESAGNKNTCGYDTCHTIKPDVLNIHLVPHTHDDVGWLKTPDQYYFGSRTSIQQAGVQYIIDSVIDELMKDSTRRFVYVETAFFNRWWSEQNDQRRHHVKRLVAEGRLEFAGGAWSMNDEASTHYQSIIDQLTWGVRMLNDTFGECGRPKSGWQIDPFGHSREMTNIWASSGFDGLLLGRVDFQDKSKRLSEREAEMIWRGSDDLGKVSDLFTGVLFNNYAPPPGFCFDVLCNDDPIIDDKNSREYNVDKMVEKFVKYAKIQANAYKTNNIIMTMGEDFFYQDARMWYKNLDKLIKYVNQIDDSVNVIYSTPSCYIKAVHDSKQKWPIKQDDFFPYASDEHSYWTGYFTSRPTIKYFERKGNNFLQVCKQLYAMTNLNEKDKVDLNMLRKAMGVMQHHDAVTGTEKQHVADDYSRTLNEGIQDCLITVNEALNKLMSEGNSAKSYLQMSLCQLNITECEITENSDAFVVTIYNPLGHVIHDTIRLPVTDDSYIVKTSTGDVIKTQIVKISDEVTRQLPFRTSSATHELVFVAENLLPLGYRAYYVEKSKSEENKLSFQSMLSTPFINSNLDQTSLKYQLVEEGTSEDDNIIGNDVLKLKINNETGLIESLIMIEDGKSTMYPLKQELLYYIGMNASNNSTYNRPSGAYIFRPNSSEALPIGKPKNTIVKGALVEELHQHFSDWASQIVRIYRGKMHVEFEWLIGPIPVEDYIGKEIISRFTTDINNEGVFYTDSNGRQLLKRIVNKRPTWNVQLHEPIAGNYYPITSMISVKDPKTKNELYVLTDRAQGGSSLNDGQIELMIHRRLLWDDKFGVGEALNETQNGAGLVARGTHYLLLKKSDEKSIPLVVTSRQIALEKLLQPAIFITPANNLTYDAWIKNRNEFSGLHTALPGNVHILTLEPWRDGSILLRLEHILSKTDDPNDLSKQAIVNLRILFSGINIISYKETSLSANQWIEDVNRLQWETSEEMADDFNKLYDKNYATNSYNKSANNEIKWPDKDKYSLIETLSEKSRSKLEEYLNLSFPSGGQNRVKRSVKDDFLVYLQPMEIKTFIIKAEFKD